MKTIYMECTLNIMSRAEVETILKAKIEMKELPNGNKYLVIVTNPE